MALIVPILINSHEIGYIMAVRNGRIKRDGPMPYNTYDVDVELDAFDGRPKLTWSGTVDHRYSDGALSLIAKCLYAAQWTEQGSHYGRSV